LVKRYSSSKFRIKELIPLEGLGRKVQEVIAGDICAITVVLKFLK
jgi:predicted membrane GTPase involved in stress response